MVQTINTSVIRHRSPIFLVLYGEHNAHGRIQETKQEPHRKSLIVSLVCILMMGVLTGAFFGHKSYDVSSGSHSFFLYFLW